jgi:hypothetical protein
VVNGAGVLGALLGSGAVDPNDPNEVLKLDPDAGNPTTFYSIQANIVRQEIYITETPTVYVFEAI